MTTLLLDDFNRADAGALGAPSVGPSPTYQSGSWEIASNQIKPSVGSEIMVWWDIGVTSYVLEATLAVKAHTSGTLLNCITFRGDGGTETSGHYWIVQANGASATWDCYYRNAGAGWTGPTGSGPTVADGQKVKIHVTPTGFRVFFDDVLYISVTDSTFGTNTQVGFRGYADTVRWDNISAYTPYSDYVLANGPEVYYNLDEASGNASDSSGNAKTLTLHTPVTRSLASLVKGGGSAIQPTGVGTGFSRTDTSLARYTGSWSIEAWVKPTASVNTAHIFGTDYDSTYVPWALSSGDTAGTVTWVGFYNGGWRRATTASQLTNGQIYHLVGTWDGTDLKLYVDGSLVDTDTPGISPATSANNDVRLGYSWTGTPAEYAGQIDEVAFYTRALSPAEILLDYEAGVGTATGAPGSAGGTDPGRIHLPQEYAVRQANQVAAHRAQR